MSQSWSVWKECVIPGRVVVPDEAGEPFAFDWDDEQIRAAEETSKGVLAAGYHIPLNWEHQDNEPDKVRMSQVDPSILRTRGIFGHVAGFRRNAKGRLEALCRGDDPDDLDRFAKVRFVSPEVQWGWVDSDGKEWDGPVVTHLAATGRPVQPKQAPLDRSRAVRMSQDGRVVGRRIRLSLDHYATAGTTGGKGMAKEKDDAPEADDDKPAETETPPADDKPAKASAWSRIAAALEGAGIRIGDGANVKDPDHLADLIEVACMNSGDPGDDEEDDLPDDTMPAGDMDQPPPGATTDSPGMMQMSLEKQTRTAEAFARKNLGREIDDLARTRRVGPAVADELRGKLKKLKMSFADDGELAPNALTIEIGAYKKNAPNAAWSPRGGKGKPGKRKVRQSHGDGKGRTAVAAPSEYESTPAADEKAEDETVAAYERAVGRKK